MTSPRSGWQHWGHHQPWRAPDHPALQGTHTGTKERPGDSRVEQTGAWPGHHPLPILSMAAIHNCRRHSETGSVDRG